MHRPRSNRKNGQDLELRLAPFPPKGSTLGCNSNTIVIEDDDDDEVQVLLQRSSSVVPFISDQDLQLRLGLRGYGVVNLLESKDGDCISSTPRKKKKLEQPYHGDRMSNEEEIKLRCSICMDAMKEETSTVCGHIFCKACITYSIKTQHRCPTCRAKLTLNKIHRIYLPGTS